MKHIFVFLLFATIAQNVYADYITQTVSNGCSPETVFPNNNGISDLTAIFEINQYNCPVDYYLPINHDGCVACPTGATCSGGNYTFDTENSQGIIGNKIIDYTPYGCVSQILYTDDGSADLYAILIPNQHTCNPGYYMPANYDGCQLCPENSYCPGGTYTFNETTTQGITACASGTFAPEGMWEVAQCGRIFHVGDDVIYLRSVRKTVHALNFDMDMDGVADYFANMTPLSVPMHINSAHGLKILLDGIEYSVYDDTVDLGLYENNPFVPAQ